jgi:hypothetical protein
MRWFLATIGLVCACAALPAWIYFRDRNMAQARAFAPIAARADALTARGDALTALRTMTGGTHCRGCGVDLLGPSSAESWNVRLRGTFGQRCLRIDVVDFEVSSDHGITGITSISCP